VTVDFNVRGAAFEAWLRRGNLEHAKITALPRAYPPKNRRRATIAQSRRPFGRPSEHLTVYANRWTAAKVTASPRDEAPRPRCLRKRMYAIMRLYEIRRGHRWNDTQLHIRLRP